MRQVSNQSYMNHFWKVFAPIISRIPWARGMWVSDLSLRLLFNSRKRYLTTHACETARTDIFVSTCLLNFSAMITFWRVEMEIFLTRLWRILYLPLTFIVVFFLGEELRFSSGLVWLKICSTISPVSLFLLFRVSKRSLPGQRKSRCALMRA